MLTQKQKHTGFTIVELLIVIVVIAILASISLVAYRGIRERAVTATYTSAVDQWDKFLQMEVAMSGSLPISSGSICLGKSADDFPGDAEFGQGVCVFSGTAEVSYSSSFFNLLQNDIGLVDGLLPVTTFNFSTLEYKSRGIFLSSTNLGYDIYWFPQVAGECGRGVSVLGGSGSAPGSLAGDYCRIHRPY